MRPSEWFVAPKAEQVARRSEVWALLGWYHATQVQPHLTVRGAFKRLWWRLTGQDRKLMSPWEELTEVMRLREAARARHAELAASNGSHDSPPQRLTGA